jgi:hypothetical protein
MPKRGAWRNSIITLLMSGQKTRLEILNALLPVYTYGAEASIDNDLSDLVKSGEIRRPVRGTYELVENNE